jgi:hypothetical protein
MLQSSMFAPRNVMKPPIASLVNALNAKNFNSDNTKGLIECSCITFLQQKLPKAHVPLVTFILKTRHSEIRNPHSEIPKQVSNFRTTHHAIA